MSNEANLPPLFSSPFLHPPSSALPSDQNPNFSSSDFQTLQQHNFDQLEAKLSSMRNQIKLSLLKGPRFINEITTELNKRISEIESERILTETWIHIELNSFYSTIEIRDNPSLSEKPIAIGDDSLIFCMNSEARRYGIQKSMPVSTGRELCEDLMIIKPDFAKYKKEGGKAREVFEAYDPEYESVGLDEGSLRVTEWLINNGTDDEQGRMCLAQKIKDEILAKTGLNATVGIACNKGLAKIACTLGASTGQHSISSNKSEIIRFMEGLELRAIPGIGKVLEKILNGFGIFNCGEIKAKKLELYLAFQRCSFDFLMKAALGISPCYHLGNRNDNSALTAFSAFKPTDKPEEIYENLKRICKDLCNQLVAKNTFAGSISVQVKNFRYEPKVGRESAGGYINGESEVFMVACRVIKLMNLKDKIREIRIGACNVVYGNHKSSKPKKEPQVKTTVKIVEQQCPICRRKLAYTEKRMEVHISQCVSSGNTKTQTKPEKKPKPTQKLTLDSFYRKK